MYKQIPGKSSRMAVEDSGVDPVVLPVGSPVTRSVCIQEQLPDTHVLLQAGRSSSFPHRCSTPSVGWDVCLCLPPSDPDPFSLTEDQVGSLYGDLDSPQVAQEVVVYSTPGFVDNLASSSTSSPRPFVPEQG